MVDFFSMFRRAGSKRRWALSPAKFAINLQSLGGAIGRIHAEPMRLPGVAERAPAAQPVTAPEKIVRPVKKPDPGREASPFAKLKPKEPSQGAGVTRTENRPAATVSTLSRPVGKRPGT